MKNLPISIQTFEKIREDNYIYIDKTKLIHEIVSKGTYYFLARPRRFGKSLLLTTLKSYFEGKKELFKGLSIYDKEKEWKKYPVVHIDYSFVTYLDGKEIFHQSLMAHLRSIAEDFQVTLKEQIVGDAFTELIKILFKNHGRVVVLIDEYDKPMVDALTNENIFSENREILKSLYGAIKGLDQYLRFVMLTGISRFSKVNVFSGMNNLKDISMHEKFSKIVGFTQSELETHFQERLHSIEVKFKTSPEKLMEKIKTHYNGFSWDGTNKLYNPFSILNFLDDKEFRNYWFSSGTPTFLIKLIKEQKQLPELLEGIKAIDLEGNTSQLKKLPLVPILFQTGYLTIQKIEYEGFHQVYHLDYPNDEVRESFIRYIAASFVAKNEYELQPEALALRDALLEERTDDFIKHLQAFLSDIPYQLHLEEEAYYHSLVYMMLRLVGVQLILEKSTDKGRIDAVLELTGKIYIIEFKFGKKNGRIKRVETLSKKAIAQIEKQKYYEPYTASGKKVILFGIGFLNKILHGRAKVLRQ